MGAEQFTDIAEGTTADEAFRAAVEAAQWDHGHGGYSGTIAEKDEFTTFIVPVLAGAGEEAIRAWVKGAMAREPADPEMRRVSDAVTDKWGPAGHIPLGGNRHLFFGWASSNEPRDTPGRA